MHNQCTHNSLCAVELSLEWIEVVNLYSTSVTLLLHGTICVAQYVNLKVYIIVLLYYIANYKTCFIVSILL